MIGNVLLKFVYLLRLLSELYSGALVIYALLSWFPNAYDSKFGRFLSRICDPYLAIFDRLPLTFGGISFSIVVAILFLNIATGIVLRILTNFALLFI